MVVSSGKTEHPAVKLGSHSLFSIPASSEAGQTVSLSMWLARGPDTQMPGFPSCVESLSHLTCLSFSSPGVEHSLEGTGPVSGPWRSSVLVNSICSTVYSLLCAVPEAVLGGLGSRLLPSSAPSGLRQVTASGFCTIPNGPVISPLPLSKNIFHLKTSSRVPPVFCLIPDSYRMNLTCTKIFRAQ